MNATNQEVEGPQTGAVASDPHGDRLFRRRVVTVVVILLLAAAGLWVVDQISALLFMVFVALFVAVAMEPPVHTLAKRGWSRGAATALVFLAAVIVTAVFLVALVPLLVSQGSQLIDQLPRYVESVSLLLEDWFGFEISQSEISDQSNAAQDWVTENVGSLLGGVVGFGSTVFGFIFFVITVGLFSFYIVAELPKLQQTVLSVLTPERQKRAIEVWETAVEKMGGYIYSRLILAVLGGTLATIFFTALKVPFSVPLGIWIGVLSQFVPVVGTYLAAILPAIVALSVSETTALWVVVFFVIYQQIENFLISPKITERTMSLHPAVSVAAIIAGGSLMGPIGIILALPFAAIVQALISTSIHRHEVVYQGREEVASD
ncbi:MAG: AI-2E family transporter [Acidimicrobiia bacterium]